MRTPTTSSEMPLPWADRTSARLRPNVQDPAAGRAASRAATRPAPIAATSVSMWPASASRASDPATRPATTSPAMNATSRPSAMVRERRSADRSCRCMSGGLLGQLRAQLEHGLRVHLADAALGDAEHLPDLSERQPLVVVESDDDLLAFRKRVDRSRQEVLRLLRLERRHRVLGFGVFEG